MKARHVPKWARMALGLLRTAVLTAAGPAAEQRSGSPRLDRSSWRSFVDLVNVELDGLMRELGLEASRTPRLYRFAMAGDFYGRVGILVSEYSERQVTIFQAVIGIGHRPTEDVLARWKKLGN